ncbi:HEXXH motif-containing putative peptide modification protein [Streptomyces sp. NPDC005227]|uniref:aKG-HExxH-type peptide beta-hydroxylase n=1 Tax=Streptomyces sp. NPDC005227 TaxID=3364707 RepID=UPI0036BA7430
MILPPVPERALTELGRTEGGPETLGLLVRDQHTRRLLLLRAVLDAAEAAGPRLLPAAALNRLHEDWALLEEVERLERAARRARGAAGPGPEARPVPGAGTGEVGALTGVFGPAGGVVSEPPAGRPARHADAFVSEPPAERATADENDQVPADRAPSPSRPPHRTGHNTSAPARPVPPPTGVRSLLLHPFTGPWARDALRGLGTATGPGPERDPGEPARALAHFGALAAVAAVRAGVSCAVRLSARDGVLTLPSLGALRTGCPGDTEVCLVHRRGRLTFRRPGEADVVVHVQSGVGAWSEAAAWTPAYALPGLLPGSAPVPLDDLDPYRTARGGPRPHTLSGPVTLDDADRKHWLHAWSGTAAALGLGGERRLTEAAALLRCLVPLSAPPGAVQGRAGGSCSGTRREAFGAVLSSAPATATAFAATLVHEIQHTKLAALGDMMTLHHADGEARHFAPWRPDPRPYDGLLQGAYSHLALADFFQRTALAARHPAERDAAWARHARYQEQVGAVLPALVGSGDLTTRGRQFVDRMVEVYERLAEQPAPRGQTARATAYVRAARTLWTQRHTPRR